MAAKRGRKYEWDVFVSHNWRQKPWVRLAVQQWRSLGLRVFFDEDCIEPGESIDKGVERGLKGSRHIVLIITPEAMCSKWVALESSITICNDPDASEKRLVPILLEPTKTENIGLTIRNAIKKTNLDRFSHVV